MAFRSFSRRVGLSQRQLSAFAPSSSIRPICSVLPNAEPPSLSSSAGDVRRHVPVLFDECIGALAAAVRSIVPTGESRVVDGTLGLGGHARGFLEELPQARLLGMDRDPAAVREAALRIAPLGPGRAELRCARFSTIRTVMDEAGWKTGAHLFLFDLGESRLCCVCE